MSNRLLLVAVIVCVACAEEGPPSLPAPDIETIVSTEPVWSEARFESEPLFEVGSVEEGGAEMFQSVATARFSYSGKIIVADNGAERVHVFSPDGDHVVTHGTTGQGPGEFRDLARALPFRGDSLVAFDFGNNRSLIFPTHEGESRAVSANFRSARAPIFGALSTGELLAYQGSARRPERVEGQWDSTTVVVFPPSGEPGEVVRRPSTQYLGSSAGQPLALAPRSVLAAGRSGFYWARTDRYSIDQFDSSGMLVRRLGRPVEPEAMRAGDASAYRTASIESARLFGAQTAAAWEQRLKEAEFAPTRPLFGSAFVDHDDRLWISELPWPSRFEPPVRWSVFSGAGDWLGDVDAPVGVTLQDAQGDRVLGRWTDELGIHYVRVYRLQAS